MKLPMKVSYASLGGGASIRLVRNSGEDLAPILDLGALQMATQHQVPFESGLSIRNTGNMATRVVALVTCVQTSRYTEKGVAGAANKIANAPLEMGDPLISVGEPTKEDNDELPGFDVLPGREVPLDLFIHALSELNGSFEIEIQKDSERVSGESEFQELDLDVDQNDRKERHVKLYFRSRAAHLRFQDDGILDFGQIIVGCSRVEPLTILNVGEFPVAFEINLNAGAGNREGFTLSCSSGHVNAGQSFSMTLAFALHADQTIDEQFSCTVELSWAGGTTVVRLVKARSAEAKLGWKLLPLTDNVGEDIAFDIAHPAYSRFNGIDFGNHLNPGNNMLIGIRIVNKGTLALNCISSVVKEGDSGDDGLEYFSIVGLGAWTDEHDSNACVTSVDFQLERDATEVIMVLFTVPSSLDMPQYASLNVNSEAGTTQIMMRGARSTIALEVVDSHLDFGEVAVDATTERCVRIKNVGGISSVYRLVLEPKTVANFGYAHFAHPISTGWEVAKKVASSEEEKTSMPLQEYRVRAGETQEVVVGLKPTYGTRIEGTLSLVPLRDGLVITQHGLKIPIFGNANSNLLRFDNLSLLNMGRLREGKSRTMTRFLINKCGMDCKFRIELSCASPGHLSKWEVSPLEGILEAESSRTVSVTFTCADVTDDMCAHALQISVINTSLNDRVDSRITAQGWLAKPVLRVEISDTHETDNAGVGGAKLVDFGTTVVGNWYHKRLFLSNTGTGTLTLSIAIDDSDAVFYLASSTSKSKEGPRERPERLVPNDHNRVSLGEGSPQQDMEFFIVCNPRATKELKARLTVTSDVSGTMHYDLRTHVVTYLIKEAWPSVLDLGRVIMGASASDAETFVLTNSGPQAYPISFSLIRTSDGATIPGDESALRVFPGLLDIPPAPGTATVSVSCVLDGLEKARNDMLPPTMETYKRSLAIFQNTPRHCILRMNMPEGRVEDIIIDSAPELEVCTLWICDGDSADRIVDDGSEGGDMLDFGTVMVQGYTTRITELRNKCPYHVPFAVGATHPEFVCKPNRGSVPPFGRVSLEVTFHPTDTFDSTRLKTVAMMNVNIMHGLMQCAPLVLRGRTREFLFNARLLGPLKFAPCFVGTQARKTLILQNNREETVKFELMIDNLSDSFHVDIKRAVDGGNDGGGGENVKNESKENAVLPGQEVKVAVTFAPRAEGVVDGVIVISTIDGDFSVNLEAQGVFCDISVEPAKKYDFGCVGCGFEKLTNVVVTNHSLLAIHVRPSLLDEEGEESAVFRMEAGTSDGAIMLLANGASTAIPIKFAPDSSDAEYGACLSIDGRMDAQDFLTLNPNSMHHVMFQGDGGVVDLEVDPKGALDLGLIPCVMPQPFTITITNSGTTLISIIATDLSGVHLSGAGVSFGERGVVSMHPHTLKLVEGECQSVTITVVVRKAGPFEMPIRFCLADASGEKNWPYVIRGTGKKSLVTNKILDILEMENLRVLYPIPPCTDSQAVLDVLAPIVSAGSPSSSIDVLTDPILPSSWIGQSEDRILGSIGVPEPALPLSIKNREFRRVTDTRQAMRYNASRGTKESSDMIWRSLRKSSTTGVF